MRRLFGLTWFILIVAAILGYSLYLDYNGVLATGQVSDKRETIRVHSADWSRSLLLTVRFHVPGELQPRYAQGYTDTATYDRTRIGDAMQVRYLPSPLLHQIVIIPTSRLAGDTTFSLNNDDSAKLLLGIGTFLLLLLLLLLAARTRSTLLGIPFLVLGALAFGYFIFPRQMPAPTGAVSSANAHVDRISTVSRILEGKGTRHGGRGMPLSQPFDIVQLSFTPAAPPSAHAQPVLAVDEIDHDSIPELSPGDTLPIQYQADQPRTVRILAGQRTFPTRARLDYLMVTGAMFLFLFLLHWIGQRIRSTATRFAQKAQSVLADPQQQAAFRNAILDREKQHAAADHHK